MSKADDNKAIVGRWFTDFWGKTCNLGIVDQLAAPDMLLQYSLHEPRRGHADIKAFMTGFREAFPDLAFEGAADLIAEGDYVVIRESKKRPKGWKPPVSISLKKKGGDKKAEAKPAAAPAAAPKK